MPATRSAALASLLLLLAMAPATAKDDLPRVAPHGSAPRGAPLAIVVHGINPTKGMLDPLADSLVRRGERAAGKSRSQLRDYGEGHEYLLSGPEHLQRTGVAFTEEAITIGVNGESHRHISSSICLISSKARSVASSRTHEPDKSSRS